MDALRFNSNEFPKQLQSQAIECFWSENLLMDVNFHACPKPAFSISAYALAGLSICSFAGKASEMVRSSSQAQASGSELIICVSKDSHVKVQRGGRSERIFAPGHAHVWLGDMATRCKVDTAYHATMISVPTAVLVKADLDIDRVLDQGIASQTAEMKLLVNYAENLLINAEQLSLEAASAATKHLREMVVFALAPASGKKEPLNTHQSRRALRLQRIKKDIRAHHNHPNISPAWIASREGISERYLRYLLADEQTHFGQLLCDMRLSQCYEQLIDVRYCHHSISSIAFNAGFNDLSYFYRIFKRRFAATPSEIRLRCSSSQK